MTDGKKTILILAGPTGIGKTALSIELAKRLSGEIISCDSMQVYRHMDIGTAKIRPEEKQGVPHFLIDEFDPDEAFNVVIFKERAKRYIEEICSRGHLPMLVGGTGFYTQAVLYDIDFGEFSDDVDCPDSPLRTELYEYAEAHGKEALFERLKAVDPEYADTIHMNNVKKVVRAIECFTETGNKMSQLNTLQRSLDSPYNFVYIYLTDDREVVYDRINKRVDLMMKEGLVDEVKGLLNSGYGRDLVSMQGLGYKETAAYLSGECSLPEAVEKIKQGTRHFAKKQLTWAKREKGVTFVNKGDFPGNEEICNYITTLVKDAEK